MGVLLFESMHLSKQAMTLDRIATADGFLFCTVETLHKSDSCPLTIAIAVNVKLTEKVQVHFFSNEEKKIKW